MDCEQREARRAFPVDPAATAVVDQELRVGPNRRCHSAQLDNCTRGEREPDSPGPLPWTLRVLRDHITPSLKLSATRSDARPCPRQRLHRARIASDTVCSHGGRPHIMASRHWHPSRTLRRLGVLRVCKGPGPGVHVAGGHGRAPGPGGPDSANLKHRRQQAGDSEYGVVLGHWAWPSGRRPGVAVTVPLRANPSRTPHIPTERVYLCGGSESRSPCQKLTLEMAI